MKSISLDAIAFTKNNNSKKSILRILSLSLVLTVSSCKKKSESPVVEPEQPKDEIVYSEFKPGINLESVRSYSTYYTVCTNTIPSPKDSTSTYDLDVNGDKVGDFRLTASHSPYTGTEYCGHCVSYNYFITISALNSDGFLAAQSTGPGTKNFKESAAINQENIWVNTIALRYQQCTMSWDFSGGYIGIKIGNNFGYLHLSSLATNGIQIQEVGFNKTPNRSITCGQK